MLDGYMSLPAWARTILAVVVVGIGITMCFIGYGGRPKSNERQLPDGTVEIEETETRGSAGMFRGGMVVTGLGAALLLFSGKSDSEKGGYNF